MSNAAYLTLYISSALLVASALSFFWDDIVAACRKKKPSPGIYDYEENPIAAGTVTADKLAAGSITLPKITRMRWPRPYLDFYLDLGVLRVHTQIFCESGIWCGEHRYLTFVFEFWKRELFRFRLYRLR